MTCNESEPLLDDMVNGTLAGEARTRLEAHLETCPACRATVADLRRIREAARSLPRMAPPADGWARLSAALDAESKSPRNVVDLASARQPKPEAARPSRSMFWGALAAAAVLVLAAASGLYMFYTPGAPAGSTTPVASGAQTAAHPESTELVQTVETELQLAEQHYQKAIAGLEQVAREGQSNLDPQTAAVLTKNMGLIDQAIRESQDALRTQPSSELAQATLFEGLRRKVDLLKDTVALINEMRKGNQAGAAQIIGKS